MTHLYLKYINRPHGIQRHVSDMSSTTVLPTPPDSSEGTESPGSSLLHTDEDVSFTPPTALPEVDGTLATSETPEKQKPHRPLYESRFFNAPRSRLRTVSDMSSSTSAASSASPSTSSAVPRETGREAESVDDHDAPLDKDSAGFEEPTNNDDAKPEARQESNSSAPRNDDDDNDDVEEDARVLPDPELQSSSRTADDGDGVETTEFDNDDDCHTVSEVANNITSVRYEDHEMTDDAKSYTVPTDNDEAPITSEYDFPHDAHRHVVDPSVSSREYADRFPLGCPSDAPDHTEGFSEVGSSVNVRTRDGESLYSYGMATVPSHDDDDDEEEEPWEERHEGKEEGDQRGAESDISGSEQSDTAAAALDASGEHTAVDAVNEDEEDEEEDEMTPQTPPKPHTAPRPQRPLYQSKHFNAQPSAHRTVSDMSSSSTTAMSTDTSAEMSVTSLAGERKQNTDAASAQGSKNEEEGPRVGPSSSSTPVDSLPPDNAASDSSHDPGASTVAPDATPHTDGDEDRDDDTSAQAAQTPASPLEDSSDKLQDDKAETSGSEYPTEDRDSARGPDGTFSEDRTPAIAVESASEVPEEIPEDGHTSGLRTLPSSADGAQDTRSDLSSSTGDSSSLLHSENEAPASAAAKPLLSDETSPHRFVPAGQEEGALCSDHSDARMSLDSKSLPAAAQDESDHSLVDDNDGDSVKRESSHDSDKAPGNGDDTASEEESNQPTNRRPLYQSKYFNPEPGTLRNVSDMSSTTTSSTSSSEPVAGMPDENLSCDPRQHAVTTSVPTSDELEKADSDTAGFVEPSSAEVVSPAHPATSDDVKKDEAPRAASDPQIADSDPVLSSSEDAQCVENHVEAPAPPSVDKEAEEEEEGEGEKTPLMQANAGDSDANESSLTARDAAGTEDEEPTHLEERESDTSILCDNARTPQEADIFSDGGTTEEDVFASHFSSQSETGEEGEKEKDDESAPATEEMTQRQDLPDESTYNTDDDGNGEEPQQLESRPLYQSKYFNVDPVTHRVVSDMSSSTAMSDDAHADSNLSSQHSGVGEPSADSVAPIPASKKTEPPRRESIVIAEEEDDTAVDPVETPQEEEQECSTEVDGGEDSTRSPALLGSSPAFPGSEASSSYLDESDAPKSSLEAASPVPASEDTDPSPSSPPLPTEVTQAAAPVGHTASSPASLEKDSTAEDEGDDVDDEVLEAKTPVSPPFSPDSPEANQGTALSGDDVSSHEQDDDDPQSSAPAASHPCSSPPVSDISAATPLPERSAIGAPRTRATQTTPELLRYPPGTDAEVQVVEEPAPTPPTPPAPLYNDWRRALVPQLRRSLTDDPPSHSSLPPFHRRPSQPRSRSGTMLSLSGHGSTERSPSCDKSLAGDTTVNSNNPAAAFAYPMVVAQRDLAELRGHHRNKTEDELLLERLERRLAMESTRTKAELNTRLQ